MNTYPINLHLFRLSIKPNSVSFETNKPFCKQSQRSSEFTGQLGYHVAELLTEDDDEDLATCGWYRWKPEGA